MTAEGGEVIGKDHAGTATAERSARLMAEQAYNPFYAIAGVREYGTPAYGRFDDWVHLQRAHADYALARLDEDPGVLQDAQARLNAIGGMVAERSRVTPYPYGADIDQLNYAFYVHVYPWEKTNVTLEQRKKQGRTDPPAEKTHALTLDRMTTRVEGLRDGIMARAK